MNQRVLTENDIEIDTFIIEVYKYLGQYMNESSEVAYIIKVRDKTNADSGIFPGRMPYPFPLCKEQDKTVRFVAKSGQVDLALPENTIFAIRQYFTDHLNSCELPNFEQKTLALEAEQFAQNWLTSIIEVATVILMVSMSFTKLLKETQDFWKHNDLTNRIYDSGTYVTYKQGIFAVHVIYTTRRKQRSGLVIQLTKGGKLLSAIDSNPIVSVGSPKLGSGEYISWEAVPEHIKNDIFIKE